MPKLAQLCIYLYVQNIANVNQISNYFSINSMYFNLIQIENFNGNILGKNHLHNKGMIFMYLYIYYIIYNIMVFIKHKLVTFIK